MVIFLLCLSWSVSLAQFEKNYYPAPIDDTISSETLRQIKVKLALDKSRINEPKGKVNDYLQELYEKRAEFVIQNFNGDYFINDTEISPYLQSILDVICKSNPQLSSEARVYAFRSNAVNAMSFGEGTIAFTLGLLSRMESEDQIAFVLCHEMAHYYAKHSDLKAIDFARLNYDKEIKKKVKEIAKSDYGQYTKFTKLIGSLGLSINKHSREKEFESDSLALLFYMNTKYDLHAPIRTLEILDSADVSLHPENIDLKKHFNFTAYPFKDHWLSYTPGSNWYASQNEVENDSLRTHPSCKKRIDALQAQLKSYNLAYKGPFYSPETKATYFQTRSDFEIVESTFHFKQYGKTLFLSLILLDRYPNNIYLHSMISKCLYQLYRYQKNHELGTVLSLPDPRFDENYDRVLTFLHALRLMEIASLSYYYPMTKKEIYGNDEEFLYACWLSSQSEVSQESPDKIKLRYKSMFPSGKYNAMMK